MALATPQDIQMLNRWSFVRLYQNNRQAFVDVARLTYGNFKRDNPNINPIDPSIIESLLIDAIRVTRPFQRKCKSLAHINPSIYPAFAKAFARDILDKDWTFIIH